MTFMTPTIASIINRAFVMARARTELLVLLALLAGILSALVYFPAAKVIEELLVVVSRNEPPLQEDIDAATAILNESGSMIIFSHVIVTAVSAFLLIPWARASAPGGLVPNDGGPGLFVRRGFRSFLHMLVANGLTVLIALFILPIAAGVAGALGNAGSIAIFLAVAAIVWISMVLTGTANLAIASEARDRRETLFTAWLRAKLYLRPIVASLASLFFVVLLINLTLGELIVGLMPASSATLVSLVVSGALIYLVSALHISGLYLVPDFRDLHEKQ